jgi:hypothetical protein
LAISTGDAALSEVANLWLAPTADALHRILLLHPPILETADSYEPFALLSQHHESEPAGSAATATLLLTDRRWRKGVAQLVRRIADSGIIGDDELDLLARTFLTADDAVYWQVPADWFADEAITIVLSDDDGDDPDREPADAQKAVVARREIFPPLRRWAASRVLAQDPATWPMLLARAAELNARDSAAVMAGVLDSLDVLPPAAQRLLIDKAKTWPQQGVRRAAFDFILARDGKQAAYLLARDDPNAKIRAWASTLVRSESQSAPDDEPASSDREPPDASEQSTLF